MGTICSACGHDNPSGLRFCAHCAAELGNVCPGCGFANPAGFKFCGQCGANLAAARLQRSSEAELRRLQSFIPSHLVDKIVGQNDKACERRNVTILFCDITGFTTLSERLDPEQVYAIMDGVFRSFVEHIYRYEGTVDKFTGDGLMALFGASLMHEDDPERAIRAALAMHETLAQFNAQQGATYGVELRCRIGLNAGEVVVGGIGSDLRLDYTVMGDAVNVAARLEQAAEPGTILASHSVYMAAAPAFEFVPVGELTLKGRQAPVRAWRPLRERSLRAPARGIAGLRSGLVGRDEELRRIREAARRGLAGSLGQLIVVQGEAGIGKSRVTAEWRSGLAGEHVAILQAASLSHTAGIGLWAFRDLFRGYFGLAEHDSLETERGKVRAILAALLGERAGDVAPYLMNLLSPELVETVDGERIAGLTPVELRQQTFLAVRHLLLAQASRQPLVLIFEDAHWIDRPSLDLLLFLLPTIAAAPIVVYAISRADQGTAAGELLALGERQFPDQVTRVHLAPLSHGDANRLLDDLLALPDLPESLREMIRQRADGNPFFLEEIIRMLIDRRVLALDATGRWRATSEDAGDLEVPNTLHGLILARVDALPEPSRHVLQCAAVIGRAFSAQLLGAVVEEPACLDASLRDLQEHGLIAGQPAPGEMSYAFHHALTQEAVYGTMLRPRRQALHRAVGFAIEEVFGDRLDEQIEILAHHFYAGDAPQRALQYAVLAGARASGRYANQEALEYYQRARALVELTPPTLEQRIAIEVGLGDVRSFLGEYDAALGHYDEALETLRAGTPAPAWRLTDVQRKAARCWERRGQYDRATMLLTEALGALRGAGEPADVLERARAQSDLGWVAFRQGDMDSAAAWTRAALADMEQSGSRQDVAAACNRLSGICYQQGQWEAAARYAERGLELREKIGYTYGVAMSYNNLSVIHMAGGDWERGILYAEQSLAMKQRIGDVEGVGISYNNLGMAHKDRGDLERARECLLQSLATAKRIQNPTLLTSTLSNLGQVAFLAGELPAAAGYLQESERVARESGMREQIVEALALATEVWTRAGDLERAAAASDEATELAGELGSRPALAQSLRGVAVLRQAEGRPAEAIEALQGALAHFNELGNQIEIGRTRFHLALALASRLDFEEAMEQAQAAVDIFTGLGAQRDLADARRQIDVWAVVRSEGMRRG